MWAIENRTRFAAERAFVRDRDGGEVWLVAVRATFEITAGGDCVVATTQEPVTRAPQYLGAGGHSALRCDTDLPRMKPGTDVLVRGSAHASGGRPVTTLRVTLAVGPIRKTLVVTGDRRYQRGLLGGLSPSNPEPFSRMPIVYERAYGGAAGPSSRRHQAIWTAHNPLGVGVRVEEGAPLPNIEYPDVPEGAAERSAPPAGFGAISSAWLPRRSYAGTYDEVWRKERQPLVPVDFDDRYFHCAPEDQRVPGYLRGGEDVALLNLTPRGKLRFQLPRIAFGFRTLLGGRLAHHRGVLHTVLIEPDESRLIMVWHSALPCHHDVYSLQQTTVTEKSILNRFSTSSAKAALP